MPDDETQTNEAAPPPPGSDEPKSADTQDEAPPRGFFGKLWHDWVKPLGLVILVVTAVRSSLFDWNDVPSGSMKPTILEGDRIVVNKLAYGFNLPFNGPKIDLPLLPTFNNPLDFLPGWQWSQPKRGDIVTFWNPTPDEVPDTSTQDEDDTRPNPSSGIRMVKRIVGVPGDTIRVTNGRLSIVDKDGNLVDVSYLDTEYRPYKAEETVVQRRTAQGWVPVVERGPTGQVQAKPVDMPVSFYLERLGGVDHFIQFLDESSGMRPNGHQFRDVPNDGSSITLLDSDNLAECEYFMVGDNRDNSADSRFYDRDFDGLRVRGDQITGKAKFIAVSFDGSWFSPAWGRFFRGFDKEAQQAAAGSE